MEIALFFLWLAIMCLLGFKVYQAQQSLKKPKETKEA